MHAMACASTHMYTDAHTNNNKMRGATRKNQLDAVTNHAKMISLDQSGMGVSVAHLDLNRLKNFTAPPHTHTASFGPDHSASTFTLQTVVLTPTSTHITTLEMTFVVTFTQSLQS